ncbi:inactive leucine-rich repeat receptor-like protein kinase CORYNE isoform X2 [Impatiens glandulifera]|nr:inactive leucine-rich repeat receptor-like protein kinase CORYNE isoform X2 [Impatiens glandulifera]
MVKFSLFILLLLFFPCNCSMQCQGRPINHISSEPPSSPSTPPRFSNKLFTSIILGILLGSITGILCSFFVACVVIRGFVRYISRTPILKGPVIFSPRIDPKTLQSALANDNQILGSSRNGTYFKTTLDNGLVVAVKRLQPLEAETNTKSVKREMQQQLEILASLRHRNLMSLRAYVREPDRFCLVYDYMPAGSLADAMNRVRENELELRWELRLRIAVGIVKGLQHLHFGCVPRVFHYNLKPANVMLDSEFEPRLADFGLAKLMPKMDIATTMSSGYRAPECFQNCRYTDKSDVMSFGVILSVLLTGRDPMDPFFIEESSSGSGHGSIGRWLQHQQEAGEAKEVLDKRIIGEEVEEDEMLMAVRIAVACLSDLPADRPSSDELVAMLTQLHSF